MFVNVKIFHISPAEPLILYPDFALTALIFGCSGQRR